MNISGWFLCALGCTVAALCVSEAVDAYSASGQNLPVSITLPKAGYVTLVIDDARGNRVRNLVSETLMPAGVNTVTWDGYDDGQRSPNGDGDPWERDLTRHLAPPGTYTVQGLVHDRLVMHYQFSVNSPGTPPWRTEDGSGAWLADHTPPGDILYLPGGVPAPNGKGMAHFIVCSSSGESGEEFVWLNEYGQRLYGTNTGFWGGTHLCRDLGPKADPDVTAYVFMSGERDTDNNNMEIRAIKRSGEIQTVQNYKFPMGWKSGVLPTFSSVQQAYGANGMAVYNSNVVFSITHLNKLMYYPANSHSDPVEIAIDSPRGTYFDRQGRLFIVSGRQIERFDHADLSSGQLGQPIVLASGLQDPHRIALDLAGNIYVSDWGTSHQVKVFNSAGRPLRTIGKSGGPQLGAYDERGMSYPAGMTVDSRGLLWVAEADVLPKRISIWHAGSGEFDRAIYGSSQYGGGGKIDGGDPSHLYMDPDWSAGIVTWKLDWKTGHSKPSAIAWRRDSKNVDTMPSTAPETVFRRDGFTYLSDSYNDYLRYNQDRGTALWKLSGDGIAHPMAIFGNAADLVSQSSGISLRHRDDIVKLWAGLDPSTVFYIWTDKNGDGIAEPDEVQFKQIRSPKDGQFLKDAGLGVQVMPDLSLISTWGTHIAAPAIDTRGVPVYSMNKVDFVGDPSQYSERVVGGSHVLYVRVGDLGLTGSRTDGTHFWSYQSAEGGEPVPGLLTQPTRLIGLPVTPRLGEAGPIIGQNSDRGGLFLLTLDGLFLQTLGGDMRCTPLWRMPKATRGMSLDGISFEDEHFHPTMTQLESDGSIYLVVGKEHSSIAKLDGLESVKRLPAQTIKVGSQFAELPLTMTIPANKTGRNSMDVELTQSQIGMDANPSNWPASANWAAIDARASASVAVYGSTLYAFWKTGDPDAVLGGSGDFRYQFKRGGALDVMIGSKDNGLQRHEPSAGDERLLVTMVDGKVRAVLSRPVAPEAAAADGILYQSPIGEVHFDMVKDISDRVSLVSNKGNYEIAVPFDALQMSVPSSGDEILADIGLLRGNSGQTVQRVYWNNQDTSLVSDVPSEARLSPAEWGIWKFTPAN